MATDPQFDQAAAHKFFAANCFNQVWELMNKENRTPEEDQQMIRLNQASMWHWTQRDDCTDKNMSIGCWQASRIYSILGQADNARNYGLLSLEFSTSQEPFYLAYAHEALARAEKVAGNGEAAEEHIRKAQAMAAEIDDPEDRKALEDDLETIT